VASAPACSSAKYLLAKPTKAGCQVRDAAGDLDPSEGNEVPAIRALQDPPAVSRRVRLRGLSCRPARFAERQGRRGNSGVSSEVPSLASTILMATPVTCPTISASVPCMYCRMVHGESGWGTSKSLFPCSSHQAQA
jgi:hypothetical protein